MARDLMIGLLIKFILLVGLIFWVRQQIKPKVEPYGFLKMEAFVK